MNPYGADERLWSYGFTIGRINGDDDGYVNLVVDSRGVWSIGVRVPRTSRLPGCTLGRCPNC